MNKVELVGRLTRDPEVKYGQGTDSTVARFGIAVNRKFKNKDGDYDADFPSCVAFGKTAEFVEKYFRKGMAIGITGRIQTGKYTNRDGVTVYTTDVVAEDVEFVESKNSQNGGSQNEKPAQQEAPASSSSDGFMNIPDNIDEELPFN